MMNAGRGGTVTWRPQPWKDVDREAGEPLSDSDSEEEDFPDDYSTPLGEYVTQGLKQLFDARQLCDVTLLVEGKKFMCHRVLLAAVSPYFRAMFTSPLVESRLTEIRLEEVTPFIMETVIQFVYTGEAGLSLDTAEDLFVAANRLQVMPLQDLCSRFLVKHLSVENCLGMYSLARSHHDQLLLRASLRLVGQHFPRASRQRDFLLLDPGTLGSLLESDRLGVETETEVYAAARRWAEYKPDDRFVHMPNLLRHLRPGLLTPEECRRMNQELGPRASTEVMKGPLRPREGMFEKKIVCVDLRPRESESLQERDFTVDCFDPPTGKWKKLASLGSLLCPGCTAVDGRLFVAGGILRSGQVSASLHEYDVVLNRWIARPLLAEPRAMLGLLGCEGYLYALGGCNRTKFLDTCERFDLNALTWETGPRLPLPLRSFACAALRCRLYLLGGTTLDHSRAVVHAGVLIYHTVAKTWCRVTLDSGATCLAGGVAVRGGVCAVGGYLRDAAMFMDGNFTNTEPLDATGRVLFFREGRVSGLERELIVGADRGGGGTPSQVVFPGLPRRIAAAGVARWKHRIYVLGGENGSRFYDSIYCWKPGWRSWVQRREKLPVDTGGVSQFGCTTLKFPKKHIFTRLRAAQQKRNKAEKRQTRSCRLLRLQEGDF
nr:kelch-like protein diablo [Misgurnus anguillicaudatus]